jgi:hypothetical protein
VVLLTHSGPPSVRRERAYTLGLTHPTRPLSLLAGGPSLKGLPARRGIVNNLTTADTSQRPQPGETGAVYLPAGGWGEPEARSRLGSAQIVPSAKSNVVFRWANTHFP